MPFEPGSRLGRIRIDALLGRGGMGAVYRGFDERLERPVAVKEIHAENRTSAVRARFLREARALSQLDHPNICRIYDVLERIDGDYLILELIEGETLRQRAEGGMPREEALRIALQVARVLAVAHARGIVHRDLKPDNVMLTKSNEVKVLDFGLARFSGDVPVPPLEMEDFVHDDVDKTAVLGRPQSTTAPDVTHTSAGSLVGTVTYMSPEQARGLPVDSASDIYSLGILLYELLNGKRAYGEPADDLLRRVRMADVEWRALGSHELEMLLRRLMSLRPADRPSADEVVAALEELLARPARRRRRWLAAGFVAAMLAILVGVISATRYVADSRAVLSAERRGRLAFLPFRNETGDRSLQWVEIGLTELVAGGVAGVRGVTVVPPEETLRAIRDLKIPRNAPPTDEQRNRLLDTLGADALIEATVVGDEREKYTIRFSAAGPEHVDSPREVSSSVLTEAANQMVREIGLRLDPGAPPADLRARYSYDAFANTAYAIGEQEALVRGPKAAAKYFAVAIDRDPGFAAAKLQLAEARNAMGEAGEAMRLAHETIAQARKRNDPRTLGIALVRLAGFHVDRSDYANGERVAAEALQIATRTGDARLAMSARNVLGHAAWRTGRLDRADAMFRSALATAVELRELSLQPGILNNVALIAEDRKRYGEAERLYTHGLRIADRVNHREAAATLIGNLANVKTAIGKQAEAEPLVRRQLVLSRELGDRMTEIIALVNLAILTYSRGEEEEAIALTAEAAEVAKKINDPRVEAMARANLATARTKRGDLDQAGRDAQAALALLPRLQGDAETIGEVRLGHVYWLIRMGREDEAERLIDKVEREWEVNGRTLRMRARAAYERGDYAAAAALVRRAKAAGGQWLRQDEQMYGALVEAGRTGRKATVEFEGGGFGR